VGEAERSASSNFNAISGVHYFSGRKHSALFAAPQGDHRSKVFPQKFFRIHFVVPVILSELMTPETGFVKPEASGGEGLPRRTTKMPPDRPKQIIDLFGSIS
jgi:hypothetical protein